MARKRSLKRGFGKSGCVRRGLRLVLAAFRRGAEASANCFGFRRRGMKGGSLKDRVWEGGL